MGNRGLGALSTCLQVGEGAAEDPTHPAVQCPRFLCPRPLESSPHLGGNVTNESTGGRTKQSKYLLGYLRAVTASLCLPALPWVRSAGTWWSPAARRIRYALLGWWPRQGPFPGLSSSWVFKPAQVSSRQHQQSWWGPDPQGGKPPEKYRSDF